MVSITVHDNPHLNQQSVLQTVVCNTLFSCCGAATYACEHTEGQNSAYRAASAVHPVCQPMLCTSTGIKPIYITRVMWHMSQCASRECMMHPDLSSHDTNAPTKNPHSCTVSQRPHPRQSRAHMIHGAYTARHAQHAALWLLQRLCIAEHVGDSALFKQDHLLPDSTFTQHCWLLCTQLSTTGHTLHTRRW